MASGGSALNWYLKNFAQHLSECATSSGQNLHQYMDSISSSVPAGAQGVIIVPYFLGEKTPIHDADARALAARVAAHLETLLTDD